MSRRPEELREHEVELDRLLEGMGDELASRAGRRARAKSARVRTVAAAAVVLIVAAAASFAMRQTGPALHEVPTFTPFALAPVLTNRAEALDVLERAYPDELRQAAVEGATTVYLFVSDAGTVENALVGESSGHEMLDRAALSVAGSMRFTAAIQGDAPVEVWIQIPVVFSLDDSPCARCRGIGAAAPLPVEP